jgi:Cellulose synthase subunit D
MAAPKKIDYRIQRQSARQWRSLLSATAQCLSSQGESAKLQELMYDIGVQFASQTTLPSCDTLENLQTAMCSVWRDMDWGRVELEEEQGVLRIIHHGSTNGTLRPDAYGDATPYWVELFLKGSYQKWLASMGANEHLLVRQVSETDEFGTTEYQLGK